MPPPAWREPGLKKGPFFTAARIPMWDRYGQPRRPFQGARGPPLGNQSDLKIVKNRAKPLRNRPRQHHLEKPTKKCDTGPPNPGKVELWLESECNPANGPKHEKNAKKTSQGSPKWSPMRAKTTSRHLGPWLGRLK